MLEPGRNATARRSIVAALVALWIAGCGSGSSPVNPDKARETLQSTLEAWKQKRTPQSLRKDSPEVVVQDMDWQAGRELLSFELLGEGTPADANLKCRVRLTLIGIDGKQVEKEVGYVVGTSPVLTVFRDLPQ